MPRITFPEQGKSICVSPDSTILQAAQKLGIDLNAPCGGNGTCGKCRVIANGETVLACGHFVREDTTVELPRQCTAQIMTAGQTGETVLNPIKPGYLLAFDIGTTTVVCFLLSPDGEELAAESMLNPQTTFGADVISRIQYALNGGAEALTAAIREGMTGLIAKCCAKAKIAPEAISVISVVGNPCMQQLFLGMDVRNLAAVPFAPVITEALIQPAADYLSICPEAVLVTAPDIAGFVGADTMGCILAAKLHEAAETLLMVDIGTNGEMVLVHRGRMAACSTAAGPALEGANIQFGMRGAAGAIDHVWLENGDLRCSVIGSGEAVGICGSGIIDAVAAMLDLKLLNKRGRIQSSEEIDGQRFFRLQGDVYLTQNDIRQVQLAKGAIAAGILLMCQQLGIDVGDIDRVILAGAFGSFMDPEKACRIGLLPPALRGKIHAAGNIAGAGAKMLALDRTQISLSEALVSQVKFLELADLPDFQLTFAKAMSFDV